MTKQIKKNTKEMNKMRNKLILNKKPSLPQK